MEPLIADSRPGTYALWLTIAEPLRRDRRLFIATIYRKALPGF